MAGLTLLRDETGSSLLITLVLITVMTVLIGAVLMLHSAQYRFIRRDAHRQQARYAAEAGVYVALDSLQQQPYWHPKDALIPLPDGQESRVTVERFGGYLLIRSVSQYRRSRSTVRAMVGEVPPAAFQNAVMLWDVESSLHVAGHTQIIGSIVVGQRGLKKSTFKRRRFTGRIDGTVYKMPDLLPPYFDEYFLHESVMDLDRKVGSGGRDAFPPAEDRPLATHLPSENPVYRQPGDVLLTEADSLLFIQPITVVAGGNLILEGPLHFKPGTLFIAGKTLELLGRVTGREGLFYGRDGVTLADSVRCAGQFFSRGLIRVQTSAYLHYPSVLYITGEAAEAGGSILVEDGAVVDGTLIHPRLEPEPAVPRGRIVVEPHAWVRGALVNAHETEMHGTLYGSLLTHQLYFYESPTSYVNWLKDAVVAVPERPLAYVLPLRFSLRPRLAVLHWETHVDEPRAAL